MKITKHISFFYIEERIKYINNIINETNNYDNLTDIYIHTNKKEVVVNTFNNYTNGNIKIIYHDLSNENPHYLTWKCRSLLKTQRNEYDIFIYIEDDILVPNKAIKYWIEYNENLIAMNYNLGFVRIEIDAHNDEYITDLYGTQLDTVINLKCNDDKLNFCVNNKNPYCAFWIYNKKEFNRFVDSKYYDINNILDYNIREKSAFGLHGLRTNWYKSTLIPIINNKLHLDCRIYHMPNNYVMDKNTLYATIKFNNAIKNGTVKY